MRFHAKGALLFLLLYMPVTSIAVAQEKQASSNEAYRVTRESPGLQQTTIGSRAPTRSEGLAILDVALDSRHHAEFGFDCSHFVHGIYERAGLPYEYASSSELYAGIDEFRRVANPQPGDLAVWRGHAGIVVNPVEHSFFSVLRSGPGLASYDSPYWKRRGRPHFFRYVKSVPRGARSTPIRTASWKPTVLGNTEPRETDVDDPGSNQTGSSARLAENQIVNAETPRVVVLNFARNKPDQVTAAFLQACNDSEEKLGGRALFKSAQSLIVFGDFEVKKVHITGNQGWIDVRIDELVSLAGGKVEVRERSERQRWSLRRDDTKSWMLTPSRNAIYLPQHTAERILAHRLAQLTEDIPDNTPRNASGIQEKAELARVLDVLFGK
jgi:cell wall-associated NlpC family hydrolase